jgi:hypothetical protein
MQIIFPRLRYENIRPSLGIARSSCLPSMQLCVNAVRPRAMNVKGEYPPVKRYIMRDIAFSLPQRDWTFNALLSKVNHPYHERKPGTNRLGLGITQVRGIARGISKSDLGQADVREYALFDGKTHFPGESEKSYFIWRVFVRNRRVIYMEFSSVSESTFHSYRRPVN